MVQSLRECCRGVNKGLAMVQLFTPPTPIGALPFNYNNDTLVILHYLLMTFVVETTVCGMT